MSDSKSNVESVYMEEEDEDYSFEDIIEYFNLLLQKDK